MEDIKCKKERGNKIIISFTGYERGYRALLLQYPYLWIVLAGECSIVPFVRLCGRELTFVPMTPEVVIIF